MPMPLLLSSIYRFPLPFKFSFSINLVDFPPVTVANDVAADATTDVAIVVDLCVSTIGDKSD